jgi:glycine hydroxymethyltransferase
MATRITEGFPGDKLYPHGRTNDYFDEIEGIAIALLQEQFGAAYVEWRPVSATMANAAVFYAALRSGDVILSQDEDAGGNYSYQRRGTAGLVGANVVSIPHSGEEFDLNIEELSELADRVQPKMIVIGGSNILFPYALSEIRVIADRVGATILYDAAHVGLHVSHGDFQRPLEEGAHVMTLTSAKIMGGPIGGVVLTNDASLAEGVSRVTFPSLVQKRDMNKVAALAFTLAETKAFGANWSRQSVANARALARALDSQEFELLARDRGYTNTHQIFLKLGAAARLFETRCNNANIILTDCALTGDLARGQRNGSRIGTHEVTRLGMKEAEMEEIARLIRRAYYGEEPERVAADVKQLLSHHGRIVYSFDQHA